MICAVPTFSPTSSCCLPSLALHITPPFLLLPPPILLYKHSEYYKTYTFTLSLSLSPPSYLSTVLIRHLSLHFLQALIAINNHRSFFPFSFISGPLTHSHHPLSKPHLKIVIVISFLSSIFRELQFLHVHVLSIHDLLRQKLTCLCSSASLTQALTLPPPFPPFCMHYSLPLPHHCLSCLSCPSLPFLPPWPLPLYSTALYKNNETCHRTIKRG